jgi:hypothetical protein
VSLRGGRISLSPKIAIASHDSNQTGEKMKSTAPVSMDDFLQAAYEVAAEIAYSENDLGGNFPDQDLLWSYADGLVSKRVCNIISGCCSLQAFIDFDREAEKREISDHLTLFQEFLKMHDPSNL